MGRRKNAALADEIEKYCDLVWYARCASRIVQSPEEIKKTPKDIIAGMEKNMRRVEETYDPEFLMQGVTDDRELGRWEGWLAALRWSLGDDDCLMDT